MCLRQALTHTRKNRHARVCCWAESPLRPQASVVATMCLKLTLETHYAREFDHVALFIFTSTPLRLRVLPNHSPLLFPSSAQRRTTGGRLQEAQKDKAFAWKDGFSKKATNTPGFHTENQIICRDMTDTFFFGGFQVATELGILIKWSKRPHAAIEQPSP